MKDLRKELREFELDNNLLQMDYCSKEEQKKFNKMKKDKLPLPEDINEDSFGSFFRYTYSDLSQDELNKLLLFRKLSYLKSIRNCAIYFVILSILSFVATVFITGFAS